MKGQHAGPLLGLFMLSVVVPLSGCVNHSRLTEWESEGWRLGRVTQILERRDLKNDQDLECIPQHAPDRMTSSRFAVVWYSNSIGARGRYALTVPIPDGLELNIGDAVQINVLDCKKPISLNIGDR
jgi:hypothetical protein